MLMSDQPDDSEVLLVSFELEQLLGEMALGETTPKVYIYIYISKIVRIIACRRCLCAFDWKHKLSFIISQVSCRILTFLSPYDTVFP